MALTAVLTGTYRNPELRFKFGWGASLPNGKSAQDWIKKLPGRRWDNSEKAWYITGTGTHPDRFFASARIEVDYSEATGDLAGLDSLESLWRPMVQRSARFPHMAFVRPRMVGFERVSTILGPGAVWDKTRQRFEVMLSDLVTDEGEPKKGMRLDPGTWAAAVETRQLEAIPENVRAAARELAASTGAEGDEQKELSPRTKELIDIVASHTGYLPDWFGLALYPFQVAGAYAIVGGHRALADAPGLGKCVLPDTRVLANGAYVPIDELWTATAADSQPTADHDGVGEIIKLAPGQLRVQALNDGAAVARTVSASHLYRERITAPVKSIRTASGAAITATLTHNFLTSTGWRSDIKSGDMIAVPDNTPFEVSHPHTSIELARFMAWQIGEGYEHKGPRVEITNNDTDMLRCLVADYKAITEQLGIPLANEPKITKRGEKCPQLIFGATFWRRWLEANGYPYGKLAAGKSIPSFIMGAPLPVQKEFLANYFSAEGSFSVKNAVLEIVSASRVLMLQLQAMLARFGVAMNLADRQKCATNGARIMRTYTNGVITGEDIVTFRAKVGFADDVKNGRLDGYRETAVSNISRRIPCIDVVKEFIAAGVPARAFGSSGSLTSTMARSGMTRRVAEKCVSTLRSISDGSLKQRYLDATGHRWTQGAISALDSIPSWVADDAIESIEGMMSTNIRWTRVTSVEYRDYDGWVYDFTVPEGANYIAEGLWCHNTRQALAAAAIARSRRTVIVVPPLVVENWCREAYAALGPGLKKIQPPEEPAAEPAPTKRKSKAKKPPKKPDFPPYIVPIRAGKKVPPFPDAGVVVVADSLLGSRPELLDDLVAWGPHAALFDEVHRSRTWAGKRATANRNLACSIDALRLPMTGTPFLQNPAEGVNMLAIAGLLDSVFGGASKFMETYTTQNNFGAFLPNRKMLPELEQRLTHSCWVRRNKGDVLKQLPPKLRSTKYVEIDPKGFKAAHDTLFEKITEWIDEQRELGENITKESIKMFARSRVDLITPLRAAAGIAKIPAAIDIITDWMEQTTEIGSNGKKIYTRPLTVWVHHQPVMQALIEAVEKAGIADAGFIDGGVAQHKRQQVADKMQNGEIGVIFCSIGAAGFGITLTASADTIFIETDWTPANISQAEDRNSRIGQTEVCMVTTLLATNTLDAHMRAILRNKAKHLNVLMPGADNNVTKMTSVLNEEENAYEALTEENRELEKKFKSLGDIIEDIVQDVLYTRGYELAA